MRKEWNDMKKLISLLLAMVIVISICVPSFAAGVNGECYDIPVEYSDNVGYPEMLRIMIQDDHVYVDAKMLAERLGYSFSADGRSAMIYNEDISGNVPYGLTEFSFNSTQVSHILFNHYIETYEAPFASVQNSNGSWIPFEYSLLLLNSSMMITDDAVLIDMPTKRVIDYFYDIAYNTTKYTFDWADDFGYTESDIKILGGSSHLINVFSGLLEFDGASWAAIFQQFAGSMDSYDKKYGENLTTLLCTESDKELNASIKEVNLLLDVLEDDGALADILSNTSARLDSDVGTLYRHCEKILEQVKLGNSPLVSYNRSYQALEAALDKQTWFSNTGGTILETQKGISNVAGEAFDFLDAGAKVLEVTGYAKEFQNQDAFALAALKYYLDREGDSLELPEKMRESMVDHSNALSSSVAEYTTRQFVKNVDQWIIDELPMDEMLGTQAAGALFAWNIASNVIPFISNGLSGADSFELALYSMLFQMESFFNYTSKRDSILERTEKITPENLYHVAQYCYIFLKSSYVTREAALASLISSSKETKERIQPLIDYQNSINAEIATIMVALKRANKTNDGCVFGFLPSDNQDYLAKYNDTQLLLWIRDAKQAVDEIELKVHYDAVEEYATIKGYNRAGDVVWQYETERFVGTELPSVVPIGEKDDCYYFVENTSVVCLDKQTGEVLWKNDDLDARASGSVLGETAIYLCCRYHPSFYAVSYSGQTLARIEQFDPDYTAFAYKMELQDDRIAVYMEGGDVPYYHFKIFYVDIETYAVSAEPDETATDTRSIDELSRLLNDYFASYQWGDDDIISGSVFNGDWVTNTEASFELRVHTKSAEWTHNANILIGMVFINSKTLTGYVKWNGGNTKDIDLNDRQDTVNISQDDATRIACKHWNYSPGDIAPETGFELSVVPEFGGGLLEDPKTGKLYYSYMLRWLVVDSEDETNTWWSTCDIIFIDAETGECGPPIYDVVRKE